MYAATYRTVCYGWRVGIVNSIVIVTAAAVYYLIILYYLSTTHLELVMGPYNTRIISLAKEIWR